MTDFQPHHDFRAAYHNVRELPVMQCSEEQDDDVLPLPTTQEMALYKRSLQTPPTDLRMPRKKARSNDEDSSGEDMYCDSDEDKYICDAMDMAPPPYVDPGPDPQPERIFPQEDLSPDDVWITWNMLRTEFMPLIEQLHQLQESKDYTLDQIHCHRHDID